MLFTGSAAAMVTPFNQDGINFDVLGQIIEHLISNGTAAIVVNGTTGEPATQTDAERRAVIKSTVEIVNKRVPVVAGTGSNNTRHAAELSVEAQALGVDAVMAVTPYYNKCTQNGLYLHFKTIAEAIKIPLIAYNVPTRTNVNIKPETMLRFKDIKNLTAVKEASGDIDQLQPAAAALEAIGVDMYIGDDSLTMVGYLLGASGLISVAANCIPKQMSKLCALCAKGEYEKARRLQFALMPLMRQLFCEVNPIPVKRAMQLIGIDAGEPRLPLTPLEQQHEQQLKTALENALLL